MAIVDDLAQKVKGKGQKLKGRMDPDRVRGRIDEMKGAINEAAADAKVKIRETEEKSR